MPDPPRRRDNPNDFWSCQVWQRSRKLISWRGGIVAVGVGVVAALLIPRAANEQPLVSDLAATALTFASISFGACLTGAVLALTVPSKDQRDYWSRSGLPGSRFSHFSDLIFVFTWSAMSQLAVVGASVGLYLAEASPTTVSTQHAGIALRVVLAILGAVGVNAVLQLTTVVKTISQLGVVGATGKSNTDRGQ